MSKLELLTFEEVREILGISKWSLREWCRTGKICPWIEIGDRTKRWEASEFRAWYKSRKKSSAISE